MIVRVDQAVWTDPQTAGVALAALCHLTRPAHHALLTAPLWDESDDRHPVSAWLARNGWRHDPPSPIAESIAEHLRAGIERAADLDRDGVPHLRVIAGVTDWRRGRLSMADALMLLGRPLMLLVENDVNDGAFVRRFGTPNQRASLEAALDGHHAQFVNGGGIDAIRAALDAYEDPTGRDTWLGRLRTWVLLDRDGAAHDWRLEDDKKSGPARQQLERLSSDAALAAPWPLTGHQLHRRAIENYVPPRALVEWWPGAFTTTTRERDRRRRQAEAFAGFPLSLRRVYPMKKKLPRADDLTSHGVPADWAEAHAALDALDPPVRAVFEHDKGLKKIAKAWSTDGAIPAAWPADPDLDPDEQRTLVEEGQRIVESILRSL